jgi:hypothetical protein
MFVARGYSRDDKEWSAYEKRHSAYADVRAFGSVGSIVTAPDEASRAHAWSAAVLNGQHVEPFQPLPDGAPPAPGSPPPAATGRPG